MGCTGVHIHTHIRIGSLEQGVGYPLDNAAFRVSRESPVDVLVIKRPPLQPLVRTKGIDQREEVDSALGSLDPEALHQQIDGVDAVEFVAMQASHNGHRRPIRAKAQPMELVGTPIGCLDLEDHAHATTTRATMLPG